MAWAWEGERGGKEVTAGGCAEVSDGEVRQSKEGSSPYRSRQQSRGR